MRALCLAAVVLAGCLSAAPARAGTVAVETTSCTGDSCRYCGDACDTSRLVLRADPGEANRVRIAVDGDGFAFSDAGAPLRAGPGCAATAPGTVSCRGGGTPTVLLGDGDDGLVGSDLAESVDGGPGRDTLLGGGGDDRFEDVDAAADEIDGGPGLDELAHWGARGRVSVDLARGAAAHGGRVTAVERVIGGDGPDVLRGGPAGDLLYGNPGPDLLAGGGGDDELHGDAGTDRFRCGPGGADVVVEPSAAELVPADCERVGSGDVLTMPSRPRLARGGRRLSFPAACDADETDGCPFSIRVRDPRAGWRAAARRRVRAGDRIRIAVRLPRPIRRRTVLELGVDNGVLSLVVRYRVRIGPSGA